MTESNIFYLAIIVISCLYFAAKKLHARKLALAYVGSGYQRYQSKPIARLAYRIKPRDVIMPVDETTSEIAINGQLVRFRHYQEVMAGDYVVNNGEDDIYHCPATVFSERNIV
jgi:hypothetical protein